MLRPEVENSSKMIWPPSDLEGFFLLLSKPCSEQNWWKEFPRRESNPGRGGESAES